MFRKLVKSVTSVKREKGLQFTVVFRLTLYLGPFSNQKVEYNYALVLCDSNTRYPFAYPLRSLSAKNVCNDLIQVFQMMGIPSTIRSDCGSNFTSQLTTTFLKYLGCSLNFNVPGRPQQPGLCKRLIGTLKHMISKVAAYHKHLGFILWALRECPNSTVGVPPWLLVYGRLPRGRPPSRFIFPYWLANPL